MSNEIIKVPDIGEYSNVEIIEIQVSEGDVVAAEDSLITLETDKATMEVPAPKAGKIAKLLIKEGDTVSEGDAILEMAASGASEEAASQAAEPEAATPATASVMDLVVPDIGEYSDVEVIEVLVSEGDTVEVEGSLISLETDKATMEVPSATAGKIVSLTVKVGDKVSEGDVIGQIESVSASTSTPAPKADKASQAQAPKAPAKKAPKESAPVATVTLGNASIYASPSIRRFARDLGVELSSVSGSGRKGRITQKDVAAFVKGVMQGGGAASSGSGLDLLADPVVDFAKFGEIETAKLSRIKKISGANLQRNWIKIPHITFFEDADITECEAFRKAKKAHAEKMGVKVTPLAFILKAVAKALVAFPNMNSSLSASGNELVLKKYVHIGVAVDTPNGLMVPVIRNVDQKGIYEIAKDLMDMSLKARDGKLAGSDMQGGCFTISSLGVIGTEYFTPIVNMPEVGILGISKSKMKPVWDGQNFIPRLMLPLSLSVDHRVIDGAEAGKFVVTVAQYLSDLKELIL